MISHLQRPHFLYAHNVLAAAVNGSNNAAVSPNTAIQVVWSVLLHLENGPRDIDRQRSALVCTWRSSTSLAESQLPCCRCLETRQLVGLLDPQLTESCIIIYPYVLDSRESHLMSGNKVFKEPAVAVVPTAPPAAALGLRFSSLSLDDWFL